MNKDLNEEQIIFSGLMTWLKDFHRDKYFRYIREQDPEKKKGLAKEFLRLKISIEPGEAYALPVSLMKKIGIEIREDYQPDPREQKLIDMIGGEIVGVVS